jgi:hypothetical protein
MTGGYPAADLAAAVTEDVVVLALVCDDLSFDREVSSQSGLAQLRHRRNRGDRCGACELRVCRHGEHTANKLPNPRMPWSPLVLV